MRIWHQSFTVLEELPAYAAELDKHFKKVALPTTEVVLHGMHPQTYETNYPGVDIRYSYLQYLHGQQFALRAIHAEEQNYDAYAIMSLPEPALREARTLVDIPVVGYGESSFITASLLGQRFGVLLFIKEMSPIVDRNLESYGLRDRYVGAYDVGFGFSDVLAAYDSADALIDKFHVASRKLIQMGCDVIIPGEAPLCLLLAKNGISRIDEAPVVDSLAATVKMAEMMADLRMTSGLRHARRGYFSDQPPRKRVKELLDFYGISGLSPAK